MNLYLFLSTLVLFILGMLWKTNHWLDLFVKVGLLVLSLVGLIYLLECLGYLIKV